MKTKRNNRRNKNKTRRGGGTTGGSSEKSVEASGEDQSGEEGSTDTGTIEEASIGDKLTISIEPYVKELNISSMINSYDCSPMFAPENCVSNTNHSTYKQTMVKNYISNYNGNLIDSYINNSEEVNFEVGCIKNRLDTSNKTNNIIKLWEPYFKQLPINNMNQSNGHQCKLNAGYNVVVSSHQHLIDKLLKWKPPEELLQLDIRNNDNTHATVDSDLKYTEEGFMIGENEKDKKMGMRNGMIIMFEFTPQLCKEGKCNRELISDDCIDLTIMAFCEEKEISSGKIKYLYPPTEIDLTNYFEEDYIKDIKDRLNKSFNEIINEGTDKKNLPNKYRLYIIRHKYSIHNKNEGDHGDKEIKVLNAPLAYKSTDPTEENILKSYRLKRSDYNRFISSPLNRAIETLILFLNNDNNWHDNASPYKNMLDNILEKFRKILVNRCNGDIADKASGVLLKTELSNLGKCGELNPKLLRQYNDKMSRAKSLNFRAAAPIVKKATEKLKFYIPLDSAKEPQNQVAVIDYSGAHPDAHLVAQDAGKRIRKTRKRKHKRKTRRRKNKKRKSRRRSIKRR